jgi:hypothetical protein
VVPLRSTRKNGLRISTWNFGQKQAWMRVVYCESFRSFGSSYSKARLKSFFFTPLVYTERFRCSYFRTGTIELPETFTINYSHSSLFLSKVSIRNSKPSFSGAPEGDHNIVLKNIVTMQYLDSNKLAARTLFRVFIAH